MTHELLRGDGSTLQASFIKPALENPAFAHATGWGIEPKAYAYENGSHVVSDEDAAALRAHIAAEAAEDPEFWAGYIAKTISRAEKMLEITNSLATRELRDGFEALRTAIVDLVPLIAVRSLVQAELEAALIREVAEVLGGEKATADATLLLGKLFASRQESEAAREVRSFYRIALEVGRNKEVVDLVVDRSSPGVLRKLEGEYPALHGPLLEHVEEYGWIRTRHFSFDPLVPKELVQRLQKVFLRWTPETVARAGEPTPRADATETLGFEPSPGLAERIKLLETVITRRDLRIDSLLNAKHQARHSTEKFAVTLGCTPREIMHLTAGELCKAMAGTDELPRDLIEARAAGQAGPETLEGQSVSLGRAVGKVRIIFHSSQKASLELGDVLVTGLSSPDHGGDASVFPTRTDASVPVEDAAAIIIDDGGLLSHAAMISREHGIPCVVGAETATSKLVDGQVVEVDATRGQGRIIPFE